MEGNLDVDELCQSLEKIQFEEAVKCCVEAITGMHERMERIEKWIASIELKESQKIKTPTTGVVKKFPTKRSKPWKNL